jgi:hypothetical protein
LSLDSIKKRFGYAPFKSVNEFGAFIMLRGSSLLCAHKDYRWLNNEEYLS